MALYDRLVGRTDAGVPVENKIHVHTFMAALGEFERGKLSRQQIIDGFALDAGEQSELDTLTARVVGYEEAFSIGSFVNLANVGTNYDTTAASRGLGSIRFEGEGIDALEFGVRWNKIGTGTLSWQLWDESSAVEVTRIDDAAAAGDNKSQLVTRTFSPPTAKGMKTLRVRCKSTTAADDPVFYGAILRVRRVDVVRSDVFHEVLMLAEDGIAPLDTPAAVKTRLGV